MDRIHGGIGCVQFALWVYHWVGCWFISLLFGSISREEINMEIKKRCGWCTSDQIYIEYHDKEWGRPVHDDRLLFEFLILEGAQAGLSWSTILHKRANYQRLFAGFDPKQVARFDA